MKRGKLISESQTEDAAEWVEFLAESLLESHENVQGFYEHGQWFVHCLACGASWSVVDQDAGEDQPPVALEPLDLGDESCYPENM